MELVINRYKGHNNARMARPLDPGSDRCRDSKFSAQVESGTDPFTHALKPTAADLCPPYSGLPLSHRYICPPTLCLTGPCLGFA